jgi:hypothetical protein
VWVKRARTLNTKVLADVPRNRKNNARTRDRITLSTHATNSIWSIAYKLVQKISPGKQGTLELSNYGLIQWSHVLDIQPLTMPSPTPEFGQLHPKRKLPICQLLWFALSDLGTDRLETVNPPVFPLYHQVFDHVLNLSRRFAPHLGTHAPRLCFFIFGSRCLIGFWAEWGSFSGIAMEYLVKFLWFEKLLYTYDCIIYKAPFAF